MIVNCFTINLRLHLILLLLAHFKYFYKRFSNLKYYLVMSDLSERSTHNYLSQILSDNHLVITVII